MALLIFFCYSFCFFFNDTATTEIYTLSLHDALPIATMTTATSASATSTSMMVKPASCRDRKSTRLNSSHSQLSYAVFCLTKKQKKINPDEHHCRLRSPLSGVGQGRLG